MNDDEKARLFRMREVWQTDAASDFELATARQRFLSRSNSLPHASSLPRASYLPHPRGRRSAPLWVEFSLGLAFASALLLVARFGGWLPSRAGPQQIHIASTVSDIEPAAAPGDKVEEVPLPGAGDTAAEDEKASRTAQAYRATIERDGNRVEVSPATPYVVRAGESVVVTLGQEQQTVEGPAVIEFHLDPARASGWRMLLSTPEPGQIPDQGPKAGSRALRPKEPATKRVNALPEAPSLPRNLRRTGDFESSEEQARTGRYPEAVGPIESPASAPSRVEAPSWSEVAEAMRHGDHERAERALGRLSQSASRATRHSARLTLAQLWLSRGRSGEAKAILVELAEGGETEFIRRRAAELLGR